MPPIIECRSLSLLATAVACWMALAATPCRAQTTVFVVRHAEKDKLPADDPHLSDVGRARAESLARLLQSVRLTAALASEFKRTHQTVQPSADKHGLEITRYRARETAKLAKVVTTRHAGGTILVAGHSNTVPVLLAALGVDKALIPEIGHDDYDDLFVVFIGESGDVTLQRLRYGAPHGDSTGPERSDASPSRKRLPNP